MFFIYKNRNSTIKNTHRPPSQRRGTLVLTTDLNMIKRFILPVYFLSKSTKNFLFLYRLKTIRDMVGFKKLFYFIFKKPKPMVVVLPCKHDHYIYRALSLVKAPFLFPTQTTGHSNLFENPILVLRSIYSVVRLSHYARHFK